MSNLDALIIALAPNINSDGIVQWGVKNIIPIVLLVIGVGIIAGARKGQMSQNALTITNVLLGCVVIAGAVGVRQRQPGTVDRILWTSREHPAPSLAPNPARSAEAGGRVSQSPAW